jgi:hypothetical protein
MIPSRLRASSFARDFNEKTGRGKIQPDAENVQSPKAEFVTFRNPNGFTAKRI